MVSYDFQGRRYEVIALLADFPRLDASANQQQANAETIRLYPLGSKIKALINPQQPNQARSMDYLTKTLDDKDYWMLGIFAFFFIGSLVTYYLLRRAAHGKTVC